MTAVTVVPRDSYLVRWVGREAVVTLPEHFDLSNAGQIREELLSVINRGAVALIAHMTATLSCDYAGADAVIGAYQRAVTNGTQLRLVVTACIVRRVLSLNGLDRLIPIYPPWKQPSPPGACGGRPGRNSYRRSNLYNCMHYTAQTAGQGRRSSGQAPLGVRRFFRPEDRGARGRGGVEPARRPGELVPQRRHFPITVSCENPCPDNGFSSTARAS
jgi:anti-anti-sigma factor